MMCADASAIVAILLDEPLAQQCHIRIGQEKDIKISIVSVTESALAVGRVKSDYLKAGGIVQRYLNAGGIETVGVQMDILDAVMLAYSRYGKGVGHPARLNFGDCFSYVLAKQLNAPLLYVGNDFRHTDLTSAI